MVVKLRNDWSLQNTEGTPIDKHPLRLTERVSCIACRLGRVHWNDRRMHGSFHVKRIRGGEGGGSMQGAGATPLNLERTLDERLLAAVREGRVEALRPLVKAGANPNAMDPQSKLRETVIFAAAASERVEVLTALIELGAGLNVTDAQGNSPLHDAALRGRTSAAVALVERGADPDAENDYGIRPLHNAAINGHSLTIRALVAVGASVNAPSLSGATPLRWAATRGQVETVRVLIACGARHTDPAIRYRVLGQLQSARNMNSSSAVMAFEQVLDLISKEYSERHSPAVVAPLGPLHGSEGEASAETDEGPAPKSAASEVSSKVQEHDSNSAVTSSVSDVQVAEPEEASVSKRASTWDRAIPWMQETRSEWSHGGKAMDLDSMFEKVSALHAARLPGKRYFEDEESEQRKHWVTAEWNQLLQSRRKVMRGNGSLFGSGHGEEMNDVSSDSDHPWSGWSGGGKEEFENSELLLSAFEFLSEWNDQVDAEAERRRQAQIDAAGGGAIEALPDFENLVPVPSGFVQSTLRVEGVEDSSNELDKPKHASWIRRFDELASPASMSDVGGENPDPNDPDLIGPVNPNFFTLADLIYSRHEVPPHLPPVTPGQIPQPSNATKIDRWLRKSMRSQNISAEDLYEGGVPGNLDALYGAPVGAKRLPYFVFPDPSSSESDAGPEGIEGDSWLSSDSNMGRADEHVPKDLFATQRLVRQMFGGDDEAFPEGEKEQDEIAHQREGLIVVSRSPSPSGTPISMSVTSEQDNDLEGRKGLHGPEQDGYELWEDQEDSENGAVHIKQRSEPT